MESVQLVKKNRRKILQTGSGFTLYDLSIIFFKQHSQTRKRAENNRQRSLGYKTHLTQLSKPPHQQGSSRRGQGWAHLWGRLGWTLVWGSVHPWRWAWSAGPGGQRSRLVKQNKPVYHCIGSTLIYFSRPWLAEEALEVLCCHEWAILNCYNRQNLNYTRFFSSFVLLLSLCPVSFSEIIALR